MRSYSEPTTVEEALYEISRLRMELAWAAAVDGFEMSLDDALTLIRSIGDDNLTQEEQDKRDRLVAAINNLIDFVVYEEYNLYRAIPEVDPDEDLEEHEWTDYPAVQEYDFLAPYILLNKKYNETYAKVEDSDINYAMAMAATWLTWTANSWVTYNTQNDDRVRPWHQVLNGFSAKRNDFPDWMIPPIEWACRCYLECNGETIGDSVNDIKKVNAKVKVPEKPEQLDGVFDESVCKCGRIFTDKHPYFGIKNPDTELINVVINRLKEDYYGGI